VICSGGLCCGEAGGTKQALLYLMEGRFPFSVTIRIYKGGEKKAHVKFSEASARFSDRK